MCSLSLMGSTDTHTDTHRHMQIQIQIRKCSFMSVQLFFSEFLGLSLLFACNLF